MLSSRRIFACCVLYALLVVGFALWQYHEVAAAHRAALVHPRPLDVYDDAMGRLGQGGLYALTLVGGLGLALYLFLVRCSRQLTQLLEAALAGQRRPVPAARHEFALAFSVADRVGQELQLERKRGARAQERLNRLSQLLDQGVLLVSSSLQLEFANPRACELLGCADRAELERRWPELQRILDSALGSLHEGAARLDLDVPGPSGTRSLRCQVSPLAEEEAQDLLILLRDRTMLDALETDLLLASQLRALSRVYGAITHDLKAPLNAMVLNLDRLQSALRSGSGEAEAEEAEQCVAVLREELERLDRSLQALLVDTTPAGQGREEFDARAMLAEIQRLLLPQARLQSVALEAYLPGTAVRIAGQRDRLKQAILNVAINALEAMPDGGELELRLEAHPDEADVLIADSGPGIPEEVRLRIFDPHFTTKTSGTGIGLYVARSIIEAHGGEISITSVPGRGSAFRMRLPTLGHGR
jgi:signal transduction histidine kinase